MRVSAPPVEGAANDALIALIAGTLAVPRRAVRIVAGERSRQKRIAVDGVSVDAAGSDIFVVDLDRGSATRMTYGGTNAMPVWTPDGRLLFASRATGPFSIVTTAPPGSLPGMSSFATPPRPDVEAKTPPPSPPPLPSASAVLDATVTLFRLTVPPVSTETPPPVLWRRSS